MKPAKVVAVFWWETCLAVFVHFHVKRALALEPMK
jgi:hypothetical protein